MRPFHRLAQTPVRWGLRFPDGTCGSPRATTKSRGPTEQVRATMAHLSRLVERHADGECARPKALSEAARLKPAATKSCPAEAGRYEKLSASRFLVNAFCVLPRGYCLLP